MTQALEMMSRAIADTFQTLWALLGRITWNPLAWDTLTWALLALALLLAAGLGVAGRFPRTPRHAAKPKLLISLGEIRVFELGEEGEPLSLVYELGMTVSNMGSHPVQILELAVTTDQMSMPVTAEVAQLVRPHASLRFTSRLDSIVGEVGELSVYLYAPNTQRRHFKLTAPFDWEPWDHRFKISPLDQTLRPTKRLPSVAAKRQREKQWREREAAERAELEAERRREAERESLERFAETADETPETRPAEFPEDF